MRDRLTFATDNYAIVRPGSVENASDVVQSSPRAQTRRARQSIRLSTKQNWTYFLTAMRYTHVPYGCGVWPAFWSNGASGNWPVDGELDILEYWNHAKSEVSFHTVTSKEDGCRLNSSALNKPDCPHFTDVNNELLPWLRYDCQTNYSLVPPHLGCAPTSNQQIRRTGAEYASTPGVIAAEWTMQFIKVFFIPEAELPADLVNGTSPRPDTWDQFVISYYPFADSGCNLSSRSLSSPQSLVLNIELCGNRGSLEFPLGCNGVSTCTNKAKAVPGDCCYEYITNTKKSSDALASHAYFNISWIKVWKNTKIEV